jgi:hypothetical protein
VDDAPTAASHSTLIIRVAIVAGLALVVGVAISVLALRNDDGTEHGAGSAARAIARLDANGGDAYMGTIGDATDAVRLRRAVRAEIRSDEPRTGRRGSRANAQRCATALRNASGERDGRTVLLADATLAGMPAVVIGITDRGRVVVFVADAGTCEVRVAQSL